VPNRTNGLKSAPARVLHSLSDDDYGDNASPYDSEASAMMLTSKNASTLQP
jgi:hypothetical protein